MSTVVAEVDESPAIPPPRGHVLLVDFDASAREEIRRLLVAEGLDAIDAEAVEDIARLALDQEPTAVLWHAAATSQVVQATAGTLHADERTEAMPLVVTGGGHFSARSIEGLVSFVATVADSMGTAAAQTPQSLSDDDFAAALEASLRDASSCRGAVAVIDSNERVRSLHGDDPDPQVRRDLTAAVLRATTHHSGSLDVVGCDDAGRVLLLIRRRDTSWAARRLDDIAGAVTREVVAKGGVSIQLTPLIGWTTLEPGDTITAVHARLRAASSEAARRLDLRPARRQPPTRSTPRPGPAGRSKPGSVLSTLGYLTLTALLGVGLPLGVLVVAGLNDVALAHSLHVAVTVGLLVTAVTIWGEGLYSLRSIPLPPEPEGPLPPATAIIAAYLPNEASTVVETVRRFLAVDYPDLQVVLAYNTPRPLPVERELAALAAVDPRLLLLHVPDSTSKAQNVNAAIGVSLGDVVGLFDADHHPARDAFRRAHRWLAAGHDVVQGRCVVRNGATSLVSRTVAVEFETIYAVSHPGRAKLHGFGIFGGSNGYWRRSSLHETRMYASMLTEDIDSSIRLVTSGGRIVSDPGLLSSELAPTTWTRLWRQRLRWAQGWFQVSLRHLWGVWGSVTLTRRQKAGMAFLIGWREINPWFSPLILAIIVFETWRLEGRIHEAWGFNLFSVTTGAAVLTSASQAFFAWLKATTETRRSSWFWGYFVFSSVFYTEWRNLVARVAQLREAFGRREWVVTPRR